MPRALCMQCLLDFFVSSTITTILFWFVFVYAAPRWTFFLQTRRLLSALVISFS